MTIIAIYDRIILYSFANFCLGRMALDQVRYYKKKKHDLYQDCYSVTQKWIKIYGNLSVFCEVDRYIECIKEAFNLVDIVMGNILYKCKDRPYKNKYQIKTNKNGKPIYGYEYDDVEGVVDYSEGYNFFGKSRLLVQLNYKIPRELDNTREIRNFIEHNTKTIVGEYFREAFQHDKILACMDNLGETLVALGMLSPYDIRPSFEKLMVKPGDELGYSAEYVVGRLVADGNKGRVYEGVHKRLNRRVAIKELRPHTFVESQLMYEKDFLVGLNHSQIPKIYDIVGQNSTYYIVMEFINGIGLEEYYNRNHLDNARKMTLVKEIVEILKYLHNEKFMVYEELKPENIMIDNNEKVCIIDIGCSDFKAGAQGYYSYNYAFAAPEQYRGADTDFRTDIYSLGLMIKYIFYGSIDDSYIDSRSKIPVLDEIINKCAATNPDDRYRNINEVADKINAIKVKKSKLK